MKNYGLPLLFLRLWKVAVALRSARLRRALVFHRILAASEHFAVLRRRFGTVIDVGANKGQFALAALDNGCSDIRSFEPLLEECTVFRRVLSRERGVELFELALGEARGTGSMYVSQSKDSSSLLSPSEKQIDEFPGTVVVGSRSVPIDALDNLVPAQSVRRPSLLKIDVQGFELSVLKGSHRLLMELDDVYVECSFVELYSGQALFSDVDGHLRPYGFAIRGIYNVAYDSCGRAIQADIHWSRDSAI